MFDIRKIQEQTIFEAIKNQSNNETASEVVYGQNQSEDENDPTWVKNTMRRLENLFNPEKVKTIRMNCQCGYAMGEKLKLVQNLMKGANSLKDFADNERASAAGLSLINGELHLQFPFCPCPWWHKSISWRPTHGASTQPATVKCFSKKRLAAPLMLSYSKASKWVTKLV